MADEEQDEDEEKIDALVRVAMEKRIAEFVKVLDERGGFSAATEADLDPLSQLDIKAYVTAHLRWLWKDLLVKPVSKWSLEFEMVDGAMAMARFRMHDAAVAWVAKKFGTEAADEMELALDELEVDKNIDRWVKD